VTADVNYLKRIYAEQKHKAPTEILRQLEPVLIEEIRDESLDSDYRTTIMFILGAISSHLIDRGLTPLYQKIVEQERT
jgi:hypothetical protein